MNERDLEIMHIADDLLDQQNKLIEQQAKVIEALIDVIKLYGPAKLGGLNSLLKE